jgi:hypothetical protein
MDSRSEIRTIEKPFLSGIEDAADAPMRDSQASSSAQNGPVGYRAAKPNEFDPPKTTGIDQATGRHTGSLSHLLGVSRSELDGPLAQAQEVHERSWRVIQLLLDSFQQRIGEAVDNAVADVAREVPDRAKYELSLILEHFDIEAEARLAARLDQALAKATERQRAIERDLGAGAAEHQKQLAEMSSRAGAELRQHGQSLIADVQSNTAGSIEELNKSAAEITANIRQLGSKLTSELRQHTDDALQTVQARLDELWESTAGRAEKRIAEMIQTNTGTMAKQVREIVDREMSDFFSQALRRFTHSADNHSQDQAARDQKQKPFRVL